MTKAKRITLEQYQEADEMLLGFCALCGAERGGCEPDARKYECEQCGKNTVYGAQMFLEAGLVD